MDWALACYLLLDLILIVKCWNHVSTVFSTQTLMMVFWLLKSDVRSKVSKKVRVI